MGFLPVKKTWGLTHIDPRGGEDPASSQVFLLQVLPRHSQGGSARPPSPGWEAARGAEPAWAPSSGTCPVQIVQGRAGKRELGDMGFGSILSAL